MFRLSVRKKEEAEHQNPASLSLTQRVDRFREQIIKGRNDEYQRKAECFVQKVAKLEKSLNEWEKEETTKMEVKSVLGADAQ